MTKLTFGYSSIPWSSFTSVRDVHDGPLPGDRPLLIKARNGDKWFLHWDGAVTKSRGQYSCEFSKCDQDDLPPVLLSKEMVHKALAEVRPLEIRFNGDFRNAEEYIALNATLPVSSTEFR